jgi:hypothetical protein
MAKAPTPARTGRPVWMGALPAWVAEEAAEPAAEVAELSREVAELRAPEAADEADASAPEAADEADARAPEAAEDAEASAPEAAELPEAMMPEAWLAALPVSEPKTVLKPVVVGTTEPAELVTEPTRGMVVTALAALPAPDASELATDAAAEAAAPEAVANAPVRMGTAGGTLAAEGAAAVDGKQRSKTKEGDGHTNALAGSPSDGSSRLGLTAGLTRAVADTVGPVALCAEAVGVARGALELALGNGGHVVDAELLFAC